MVEALQSGNVSSILVDVYVAGYRKDLFNGTWYAVSDVINYKSAYGVVVSGYAASLQKQFREYAAKIKLKSLTTVTKAQAKDKEVMATIK